MIQSPTGHSIWLPITLKRVNFLFQRWWVTDLLAIEINLWKCSLIKVPIIKVRWIKSGAYKEIALAINIRQKRRKIQITTDWNFLPSVSRLQQVLNRDRRRKHAWAWKYIACVAGASKGGERKKERARERETRGLPLPSRVSLSRARSFFRPLLPSACYGS